MSTHSLPRLPPHRISTTSRACVHNWRHLQLAVVLSVARARAAHRAEQVRNTLWGGSRENLLTPCALNQLHAVRPGHRAVQLLRLRAGGGKPHRDGASAEVSCFCSSNDPTSRRSLFISRGWLSSSTPRRTTRTTPTTRRWSASCASAQGGGVRTRHFPHCFCRSIYEPLFLGAGVECVVMRQPGARASSLIIQSRYFSYSWLTHALAVS